MFLMFIRNVFVFLYRFLLLKHKHTKRYISHGRIAFSVHFLDSASVL